MNTYKIKLFSILMMLFFTSCSSLKGKTEVNLEIGNSLKASRYGDIYFSAQPKNKDYASLKEQGFSTIVNLRSPKEHDEAREKKLTEASGMKYENIAFPAKLKITSEFTDTVYEKIKANKGNGKVLVHCSSGNRASIWAGAHFYRHHGFSKDKSVEIAKELGLTKKKAENALKRYLDNN